MENPGQNNNKQLRRQATVTGPYGQFDADSDIEENYISSVRKGIVNSSLASLTNTNDVQLMASETNYYEQQSSDEDDDDNDGGEPRDRNVTYDPVQSLQEEMEIKGSFSLKLYI